jgi:FkbM family methyltransferase
MWSHFGLNQGDVFLDVGAHIGKYTIPISKIVGENGLVIAIEAHPENYKTLVKNIKLNGLKNIIALNVAAWNKECKLKLFNGEKNGQHSIKNDCGLGYVTVKAQALDNILDKLKVRRIDCIKIDVEKSELETLEGLVKTLKEHNPRVIVEILEDPIKVKDFMHKKGYVMQRIASHYYFLNPLRSLR